MIPLHLRKKLRTEKPKPKHFEVMPPIGSLMPGQRINVQVKFMPTEEVRGCLNLFCGKLNVQVVWQWHSTVNIFYDLRRFRPRPHCTPKEFENWYASNVFRRSTPRRRNLKTQQSQTGVYHAWGILSQGNHIIIVSLSFSTSSIFKMYSIRMKTKCRRF